MPAFSIGFNKALIGDSSIIFSDCAELDAASSTFSRSNITVIEKRPRNESVSGDMVVGCKINLTDAKVASASLMNFDVINCEKCLPFNSNIYADGRFWLESRTKAGEWSVKIERSNFSGSEILNSKFEGARLRNVDISKLNLHGVNLSDVDFNFLPDLDGDLGDSKIREWLYKDIYSNSRPIVRVAEDEVDNIFGIKGGVRPSIPKEFQLKLFGPQGLQNAWAWADRPVRGLPDGIPGPRLCDPKMRKDGDWTSGPPEGCFPDEVECDPTPLNGVRNERPSHA